MRAAAARWFAGSQVGWPAKGWFGSRAPAGAARSRRAGPAHAVRGLAHGQGLVQERLVGAVLVLAFTRKPKVVEAFAPTEPL